MHKPIVIPLAIAGGIDIVGTQVIANGSPRYAGHGPALPEAPPAFAAGPATPKPARYTEDNVVVQCRK